MTNYLVKFNSHCDPLPFRMNPIRSAIETMETCTHACKIDLRGAFNHLTMHPTYRCWFRFRWRHRLYECVALLFGWAESLQCWNNVSELIMAAARLARVRDMAIYVDDILVAAASADECARQTQILVQTLTDMGLEINLAKSVLQPTKVITYLGDLLDIEAKSIMFETQKRAQIRALAARELNAKKTTRRRIAALLGLMQGTREALLWLQPMTTLLY